MSCSNCTCTVTKALKAVYGVKDVIISLSDRVAFVRYDKRVTSLKQLQSALKAAGYAAVQLKDTEKLHFSWLGFGSAL